MSESDTTRKDEWMSLPEAAKATGLTTHTVLSRSVRGDFEAQHVAGRTIISRASVERYLAAQSPSPAA